jgi:hypothetical protein
MRCAARPALPALAAARFCVTFDEPRGQWTGSEMRCPSGVRGPRCEWAPLCCLVSRGCWGVGLAAMTECARVVCSVVSCVQGREAYFTDDGFAIGVAYILSILNQDKVCGISGAGGGVGSVFGDSRCVFLPPCGGTGAHVCVGGGGRRWG